MIIIIFIFYFIKVDSSLFFFSSRSLILVIDSLVFFSILFYFLLSLSLFCFLSLLKSLNCSRLPACLYITRCVILEIYNIFFKKQGVYIMVMMMMMLYVPKFFCSLFMCIYMYTYIECLI